MVSEKEIQRCLLPLYSSSAARLSLTFQPEESYDPKPITAQTFQRSRNPMYTTKPLIQQHKWFKGRFSSINYKEAALLYDSPLHKVYDVTAGKVTFDTISTPTLIPIHGRFFLFRLWWFYRAYEQADGTFKIKWNGRYLTVLQS